MPEPPDFDQIARATMAGFTDEVTIREMAEQLRQVWNARGASDIATFDTAVAEQLETREAQRTDLDLNAVVRAIRSLDR